MLQPALPAMGGGITTYDQHVRMVSGKGAKAEWCYTTSVHSLRMSFAEAILPAVQHVAFKAVHQLCATTIPPRKGSALQACVDPVSALQDKKNKIKRLAVKCDISTHHAVITGLSVMFRYHIRL